MIIATEKPKRPIRSFVRREGRMTYSQQRALEELWPRYGIDLAKETLNLNTLFARSAAKNLEIGFGNGENLLTLAKLYPEQDYVGVEVHRPGVGSLLINLEVEEISNVKVVCADVVEMLQYIADQSLENIYILFPDPWHKRKHNKRRLIQTDFINLLHRKLCLGGHIHLATDWQDYAEHMIQVFSHHTGFHNIAGENQYTTRSKVRPLTRFERRGQRLGHQVFDLVFTKL